MDGVFPGRPQSFRHNVDQWTTAAQDEWEWRRTDEKVSAIYSKIVQLQESGTVFQLRRIFVRTTTSFIAYWKTVFENARETRYVVACLLKFFK